MRYEKTIKKKHSVNFAPNYQEDFRTSVSKTLFIAISEKTFEKLNWHLVYKDENNVEANRKQKSFGMERYTEAITANYEHGKVVVQSKSLGNEMWDLGRNSKRVKLFIYAFHEILKTLDKNALNELEKEEEKKNNWDDYIIPEQLPQPTQTKSPNILIPIIGGLIISLLLGFIVAFTSVKGIYFIVLFEFIVASIIVFTMKHLIKYSNFTDLIRLQYILASMIILTYLSNQYFQYEIIVSQNIYGRFGFWEFLKVRFSQGLRFKDLNTGWIGLLISWILQLGLTGIFVYVQMIYVLTKYVIGRVPEDVVDFAFYHLIKGKTEKEVRVELAKKGWTDKINQDEVFEAMGGIQAAMEMNRG